MGAAVLLASGVAYAPSVQCDTGQCRGTQQDDEITGTDERDRIFAYNGYDEVFAGTSSTAASSATNWPARWVTTPTSAAAEPTSSRSSKATSTTPIRATT